MNLDEFKSKHSDIYEEIKAEFDADLANLVAERDGLIKEMDVISEELEKVTSDLNTLLEDDGKAITSEDIDAAIDGERERIKSILDLSVKMPNFADYIKTLAFDPEMTVEKANVAIVEHYGEKMNSMLGDFKKSAPKPVDAVSDNTVKPTQVVKPSFEQQCKNEWETDEQIQAKFTSLETYTAFQKAKSQGLIKTH